VEGCKAKITLRPEGPTQSLGNEQLNIQLLWLTNVCSSLLLKRERGIGNAA